MSLELSVLMSDSGHICMSVCLFVCPFDLGKVEIHLQPFHLTEMTESMLIREHYHQRVH